MSIEVTLYQFQLCPFCHKVRAALDLKGLVYKKIEVAPGQKKELPALPEDAPRKVPVITIDQNTIWDSTTILHQLDHLVPTRFSLQSESEVINEVSSRFEDWVDDNLIPAIPTVIYGTWRDAIRAAQFTAKGSKFSLWQAINVRIFGSIIMRLIAKRILKRHGKVNGAQWVSECLDSVEAQLGDQLFITGDEATLADAALHGAIQCVEDFPIFGDIQRREMLYQWYRRLSKLRLERASSGRALESDSGNSNQKAF